MYVVDPPVVCVEQVYDIPRLDAVGKLVHYWVCFERQDKAYTLPVNLDLIDRLRKISAPVTYSSPVLSGGIERIARVLDPGGIGLRGQVYSRYWLRLRLFFPLSWGRRVAGPPAADT